MEWIIFATVFFSMALGFIAGAATVQSGWSFSAWCDREIARCERQLRGDSGG